MNFPSALAFDVTKLFDLGCAKAEPAQIKDNSTQKMTYLGRSYKVFSDGLSVFSDTTSKNDGMQYFVKGLFGAGAFAGATFSNKEAVKKLCTTMNVVDSYNDFFRIIPDLNYVVKLEFLDDILESRFAKITSQSLFLCSDVALGLFSLNFLKLIDTDKIARSMGEISVYGAKPLGFMTKLSLNTLASRFVLGALAVTSISCVNKMINGDFSKRNMYTAIATTCEVAFKVIILFAMAFTKTQAGVIIEGALLIATGTFGVMSVYEAGIEQKKKP